MQTVHVADGKTRYDIRLENGLIERLAETVIGQIPISRALVVSDERLWSLCGERVEASLRAARIESSALILKDGGYAATLDALREVSGSLTALGFGPRDALIGIGGGTLLDTCGFAAWHHRDVVRLIQVPTTLIGMTDWAVGGKTACEYKPGSRMIGSFFPPSMVLIDPEMAATLPDRAFTAGMGEVIKIACAADAPLFRLLETLNGRSDVQDRLEEIAWRCLEVKRHVLASDPGLSMLGHGLAHAIESVQRYRVLLHGEAVGVGALAVTRRGEALGYTTAGTTARLQLCLERYGLPTATLCDAEGMLSAIRSLGSSPDTAVPQRIGFGETLRVDNSFLVNAWFGGIAY